MSIKDWAKQEVELACKRENPNLDGESFDYGCSCYKSALKAYNTLCDEGHSGYSWNVTKNILIRLMSGQPLSAITDEDFFLNRDVNHISLETPEYLRERGMKSHIQCPRMSSLFREETLDGEVTYSDIDRVFCIDINNEHLTYTNGDSTRLVNKMFPIEMPYTPKKERFKIYTEDFLVDVENGDYDTKAYLYLITPEGERIELNIYKAEIDGKFVDISKEEFEARKLNKIK